MQTGTGKNETRIYERKTPFGIHLPATAKVELPVLPQNKDLWKGNAPLNGAMTYRNIRNLENRIPRNTQYRREIISLITAFIEHFKADKSSHSSLTMILEETENGFPVMLQVMRLNEKGNQNAILVQSVYNMPESTVIRLRQEGKIIPKK